MTLNKVELPCLTDKVKHDLQILAIQGMPNEVCGLLHKHHIIHQYANVFDGDHRDGFDMYPAVDGQDVVAIWHSHPSGLAKPSPDDVPVMQLLSRQGYDFPWIIITSRSITAWQLA